LSAARAVIVIVTVKVLLTCLTDQLRSSEAREALSRSVVCARCARQLAVFHTDSNLIGVVAVDTDGAESLRAGNALVGTGDAGSVLEFESLVAGSAGVDICGIAGRARDNAASAGSTAEGEAVSAESTGRSVSASDAVSRT
jgi:hypothetical protein